MDSRNRGTTPLVAAALAATLGSAVGAEAAGDAGRIARLFAAAEPPHADGASTEPARGATGRTPYVAGMIGSSFATDQAAGMSGTLLTGEGAIGVSLPRPLGAVRLEVEGRQRAALSGTHGRPAAAGGHDAVTIDGEWTTMANLWRDITVADHLSLYAGGGLGVGGYGHDADAAGPEAASRVTTFGWQAGAGAAYAVTDRLTLDVGARLYGLGTGAAGVTAGPPAAEMLFAVRLADPFRSWLRR